MTGIFSKEHDKQSNASLPKATRAQASKKAMEAEIIPRSDLLARAFDLGIDRYDIMTNEELVAAIHRAEEALSRSLQ